MDSIKTQMPPTMLISTGNHHYITALQCWNILKNLKQLHVYFLSVNQYIYKVSARYYRIHPIIVQTSGVYIFTGGKT